MNSPVEDTVSPAPKRPGRRPTRDYNVLEARLSPVAYYKLLLNTFLDRRPAGTRQRLAKAIGKDRSFVSQIANAGYPVPIPARYVRTIAAVCQFSDDEEQVFLRAYIAAHREQAADIYNVQRQLGGTRKLEITVPEFSSERDQQRFEIFVHDMARSAAELVARPSPDRKEA